MRILSLGQEGTLEEGMVTHSSIIAWEIPWIEEPGGILGVPHSQTRLKRLSAHTQLSFISLLKVVT